MQWTVLSPKVNHSYLPYAASYGYTLTIAAPLVGVSGNSVDSANIQFHAQNDFGQYNYGFSNPTQTKQEVKQQMESQEGAIAMSMLIILYSQKLGSSQEELMETELKI